MKKKMIHFGIVQRKLNTIFDLVCRFKNWSCAALMIGFMIGFQYPIPAQTIMHVSTYPAEGNNIAPQVHNKIITWQRTWIGALPGESESVNRKNVEIYMRDLSQAAPRAVTNTWYTEEALPKINDEFILWSNDDGQIWKYNQLSGLKTQISDTRPVNKIIQFFENYVVWSDAEVEPDKDIYLIDKSKSNYPINISSNDYRDDFSPEIHNGIITWYASDINGTEIYMYKIGNASAGVEQITDTTPEIIDKNPHIHNGIITWQRWDGNDWEIYRFDTKATGANPQPITNNSINDYAPRIHNGIITWVGEWFIEALNKKDSDIFYYDMENKSYKQIFNNLYADLNQQIHNNRITWEGANASDTEIFIYDLVKEKRTQVTNVGYDNNRNPQIHNGIITWSTLLNGNREIMAYLYDADEDGYYDFGDNCPDTPNPDQKDTNNDGIGDVCQNAQNQQQPPFPLWLQLIPLGLILLVSIIFLSKWIKRRRFSDKLVDP